MANQPAFIFLDINMPVMSGTECLIRLKADDRWKTTPVIIYTTTSDHKELRNHLTLGAHDFVTKSNSLAEVKKSINNALKYSKQNVQSEIRISSSVVKGNEIKFKLPDDAVEKPFHPITVSDNGVGSDQMHADKIFKVFTRLHADEQYRGSGIGLSIVKKVVESHNGFVWAESEPQRGSVFSLLFPV